MPVTTQFPSANATETGAGLTTPNNAHADDGSYATASPGKNTTLATKYQNFGFDSLIPVNSLITKVQIIYEFKIDTTASIATARTYYKVSGNAGSNNDDATEPAADKTNTVDVTGARSWTRADLLNGTLEIVLAAVQGNSNTAVVFSFDFVKVEATHELPVTLWQPQTNQPRFEGTGVSGY